MNSEQLNKMVSKEFNGRKIYDGGLINEIMNKGKVGSTSNKHITTLKLSDWHDEN